MKKILILTILAFFSQFLFCQEKDNSISTLEVNFMMYEGFSVNDVIRFRDPNYPYFDIAEISPANDGYYKVVFIHHENPSMYRVCHLKKGDRIETGNSIMGKWYSGTVIKCEPDRITIKWDKTNFSTTQ